MKSNVTEVREVNKPNEGFVLVKILYQNKRAENVSIDNAQTANIMYYGSDDYGFEEFKDKGEWKYLPQSITVVLPEKGKELSEKQIKSYVLKDIDNRRKEAVKSQKSMDKYEQSKNIFQNLSYIFDYKITPTTYGLTISNFRNDKNIDATNTFLQKNSIEYRTEITDLGMDYKFIISKSEENIKKLSKLVGIDSIKFSKLAQTRATRLSNLKKQG